MPRSIDTAAVHRDLVATGGFVHVATAGDEERAWQDCDLASLAENRLADRTDPRALDNKRRAEWEVRATTEKTWPLARRENYERCYWLVEGEARVGTLAVATDTLGGKLLRLSSLYVYPDLRGRGVARRALRLLQDVLGLHDLGFRLDTYWSWQRAVRFYLDTGLWLLMWKHDLTFCWEPGATPPLVEVSGEQASISVERAGRLVRLVEARRGPDSLLAFTAAELAEEDIALRWHATTTLSLAVALEGWPLIRSPMDWQQHRVGDAGPPEALARKIQIWEAWDRKEGFIVATPRIPGLAYPTWEELEAEWKAG